jgi:hypothetical protein
MLEKEIEAKKDLIYSNTFQLFKELEILDQNDPKYGELNIK